MSKDESHQQIRSREHFESTLDETLNRMNFRILDFAEVALGSKEKFASLRSKILRASNDAKRELKKDLQYHYLMEYISDTEDIIVFTNKVPSVKTI